MKDAPFDRADAFGEAELLARKHGINVDQARMLIATLGGDRTKLDKAATFLRQKQPNAAWAIERPAKTDRPRDSSADKPRGR
jgi:hypothetical protein